MVRFKFGPQYSPEPAKPAKLVQRCEFYQAGQKATARIHLGHSRRWSILFVSGAKHSTGNKEMKGATAAVLAVDIQGQPKLFNEAVHNGQAQAAAAGIAGALVGSAALERLKDRCLLFVGDPRPRIRHANFQRTMAVFFLPAGRKIDAAP